MGQRALLVVVLLVAAVGAAWLLGAGDLLSGRGGGSRGGGSDAPGATLGVAGDEAADGEASGAAGPLLFGRPRAERVGKGGLAARLLDFRTGQPVAGARAVLAGTGYGGEPVSARTTSAADGALAFADLPAGDALSLRVEAEGNAPRVLPAVQVAAGRVNDLGVIWLGRRGVLEGTVVDPEGKGVPGAVVAVHPYVGGLAEMAQDFMEMLSRLDQEQTPLARTETDRVGRFAIEDVAPGPLSLLVRAPGFALRTLKVAMTSEGAAGGDVRVVLQAGRIVAGRVVTEEGAGVAGARVAVMPENDPDAWLFGRAFADTGRDGSFRIDTLPAGNRFTAIATAAGFPTTFAQVAEGEEDARLVLRRAVPVTVRVLAAERDAPIEGATVAVAIGKEATLDNQPESLMFGTTDRAGRAELVGRPGKLQLAIITHPEYAMGMWMGAMGGQIPGMMVKPDRTEVGEAGGEITFRLPIPLVLEGRVLAPDGTPLPGAQCSTFLGFMRGAGSVTDAEGRFRLVTARFGEGMGGAIVLVKAAGYVQPPASLMVAGTPDEKGVIRHDVTLQRAAVLSGRVVDRDGAPLAGALVAFEGGPEGRGMDMAGILGPSQAFTAEDGSYVLDGATAGKGATVRARRQGYVPTASAPFDVVAGGSTRVPDLVLRRGATLLVRVASAQGAPLAGARVQVDVAGDAGRGSDFLEMMRNDAEGSTDERGLARIENLAPGKATVTATGKGHAASRATATVPEEDGAEVEASVRLRAAVPVVGRVTDPSGKPVAAARVSTGGTGAGEGWVPHASARTGADGGFRLEGLPEGDLELAVSARGYRRVAAHPVRGDRGEVAITLVPESPDVEKRRAEITTELTQVWAEFQAAKDDAERQAISERMQALSRELAELGGAAEPAPEVPDPEAPEAVPTER